MASEVRLPRLGWSMEEGTFVSWLVTDGTRIETNQPIFELEGEKALQEIEALDAGILRILPNGPKEGDVVPVGALLAYLLIEGEAPPWEAEGGTPATAAANAETSSTSTPDPTSSEPVPAAPSVRRMAREVGVPLQQVAGSGPGGRILASDVEKVGTAASKPVVMASVKERPRSTAKSTVASPRARRVARELGVDWTLVAGTGANGRVRERDVRSAATNGSNAGVPPQVTGWQSIPITSRRKTIAQRMSASSQQTAPVTLHTKVDATALVAARTRYKHEAVKVVPAYTDLIAKCVAQGLCEYPLLAGRWANDRIEYPGVDNIHIGIAVDTEDGLIVPILRDVARRPLLELSAEFRSLIDRGRRGQLKANDMQGAVFTITSLGSFGIDAFTPIINLPETAILGVGTIRKELVVLDNGSFAARDMLTLSLTFDHRVIDGAPAARFLQVVTEAMQAPPV